MSSSFGATNNVMLDEVNLTRGNSEKVQESSSLDYAEKSKMTLASDEPDTPPNESKGQTIQAAASGIKNDIKGASTSSKQNTGAASLRLNRKPQMLDSDTKS